MTVFVAKVKHLTNMIKKRIKQQWVFVKHAMTHDEPQINS